MSFALRFADIPACNVVPVPVLRAALELKVDASTVKDEFAM